LILAALSAACLSVKDSIELLDMLLGQRPSSAKVGGFGSNHEGGDTVNIGFLSDLPRERFRAMQRFIDEDDEAKRCERYGFAHHASSNSPTARRSKRKIYYGSLIASEPWELLEIVAAETYGIFDAMVFVEANRTQNFTPRSWTYYHPSVEGEPRNDASASFRELFGVATVQIRPYVDERRHITGLDREHMQRTEILKGWREMGMLPGDVGLLTDADETFTRDFLRAVQFCDEIEALDYEKHRCHYKKTGIRAYAQVFETSPECRRRQSRVVSSRSVQRTLSRRDRK